MSFHQFTTKCPQCGDEEMDCSSDSRPFDDVEGTCLMCGFHYSTTSEQLSLEHVNELREDADLEPLADLADPLPGRERPMAIAHHPFNREELITLFEVARRAFEDKALFTVFADDMDIELSVFGELADKLDRYMRPELYVSEELYSDVDVCGDEPLKCRYCGRDITEEDGGVCAICYQKELRCREQ